MVNALYILNSCSVFFFVKFSILMFILDANEEEFDDGVGLAESHEGEEDIERQGLIYNFVFIDENDYKNLCSQVQNKRLAYIFWHL